MAEDELGPLPAGRHGFSREQVAHNQRERLIAGLATAVAEKGYRAVTITDITKAARVSRRVFYENFEGKDECFLAAFEVVVGHIRELAEEAIASIQDWPDQAIAAARAVLAFSPPSPTSPASAWSSPRPPAPPSPPASTRRCTRSLPIWRREGGCATAIASCRRPPRSPPSAPWSCLPGARSPPARPSNWWTSSPDFAEFILAPYLGAEEAGGLARKQRDQ